jgi:hypothetical protein
MTTFTKAIRLSGFLPFGKSSHPISLALGNVSGSG